MLVHQLKVKAKTKAKRIGRGGKKGTYCGRGGKGQSARKGFSQRATFEGGSTSIVAFSKKNRGFKVPEKKVQLVSLKKINAFFSEEEKVNLASLKAKKLISSLKLPVKILADGDLNKKLSFQDVSLSRTAKEKIEKAGGKVEETSTKKKDAQKE